LSVGDSIRVNLKNALLLRNQNWIELDSVDAELKVVKIKTGLKIYPVDCSINELKSVGNENWFGQFVKIKNVEFIQGDKNQPFADGMNQISMKRTLTDCIGNTMILRTSGYANFASELVPADGIVISAIVGVYNGVPQLYLRSKKEVQVSEGKCLVYLKKDFEDGDLFSGGWSNLAIIHPQVNWTVSTFTSTNNSFAKISGYLNSNTLSESWLISPSVDLSLSVQPILSFQTASKYNGTDLEVLISGNYLEGDVNQAEWSLLNATISPQAANYTWMSSGNIDLKPYKYKNARIAFRYRSNISGASTYELDDVLMAEN
jgi:hypothetical protein